jgi:glutamate dehydrogenase/leucine dehydrogenase
VLGSLTGWDGEFLAARHDAPTGATLLVGVHSTVLGPGLGGTRMKVYPAPEAAVTDVLRLARAMTFKNALAGLPFGGGKAVLAVPSLPEGGARTGLLERYADLVASLRGAYVTACDMNTNERDMDVIAARTEHVMGTTEAHGGSGTSAPDTAIGVHHGIRAALAHVFGDPDPAGRRVAVQGAGAVGARLVEMLAADGAEVVVADVDPARAEAAAGRAGAVAVAADEILTTPCDVLAPCATGGVLDAGTIATLDCAVVAGAANNQLATDEDGRRLAERGIIYAPDYVVNAGGVLHLVGYERLRWSSGEMATRLAGIGDTLGRVFALADAEGITTADAADRLALERISAGISA